MKSFHLLTIGLLYNAATLVSALKIPFKRLPIRNGVSFQAASSSSGSDTSLGNVDNIRYVTNITIDELEFLVLLDTGSTDLWVKPSTSFKNFNDTGLTADLRFGDGSAQVSGRIGIGAFAFGTYSVPKQAFLNADTVSLGEVTELGIQGLMGLGFDNPGFSHVNDAITGKFGAGATFGQSVTANIFDQNPSEANLITISLSRTDDLEGTAAGVFTIGELDPTYAGVQHAPQLPQFPANSGRWATLLDGLTVNGASVPLSSNVVGAPKGKSVFMFDTGTPTAVLPDSIVNGMYSHIPGAVFDKSDNIWIVPCNATPDVEFIYSGQSFAIHPLDLSNIAQFPLNGKNYTVCTAAFTAAAGIADETMDGLLGDSFMRNVYTVFNFGTTNGSSKPTETAFMQLLSQTNAASAAKDALTVRKQTLSTMPPELPPSQLLSLISGSDSDSAAAAAAPASSPASDVDSLVDKYAPIVVGLLGANVVIGLILVVLGVLMCIRKGGRSDATRAVSARYVPVKVREDAPRNSMSYDTPYSDTQ